MTEPQDTSSPDAASTAPRRSKSGAFSISEILRQAKSEDAISLLDLQAANEIRLLLRGESVVDWHRLDFDSELDSRRLLVLNGFDWDVEPDRVRVEALRSHAADYLHRVLKFYVDEEVAHHAPFVDLPLMASGKIGSHKQQRGACVLLKVMHILHHLEARELRTQLALSDTELFESVEQSVLEIFDQLRASGAPVVEFQWSRKTRDSLLTKMLIKRETSAARVFDRLRFRLIVKQREDLIPTLRTMLRKLIPFNYVVPGQTVNSLVDLGDLEIGPSPLTTDEGRLPDANEFSGANFRVLNFIADLPVRVDRLPRGAHATGEAQNYDLPQVVFVLAEFQLLDATTARANEEGESSHAAYKMRQHSRVRERMLRVLSPDRHPAPTHESAQPSDETDELLGRVLQVDT